MLSDEQLVELALGGTSNAFDELVTRYQGRLLRFLLTRTDSRSDAEDAIQDAFINAYRYLGSFDPRWRFSTWLYRIALRNLARQRRPEWHEPDVEAVDHCDPLAACIAASENRNVWLTAKSLLPDDAFNAMWLKYVEDLSVREIARALDRSMSWTKVALFRSRQKLGAALGDATPDCAKRESYG